MTSAARGLTRLVGRAALLLAVALAPIGVADRYLAARVTTPEELQLRRLLAPGGPPRDVILGPSHAAHGIDPRRLAEGSFENFGLDGAGPGYLLGLYRLARRVRPPARAILVAPAFMFRRDALYRRLEHDAEHLAAVDALALALAPGTRLDLLLFNRFAFLKYRPFLGAGVPAAFTEASWQTRGFMPYRGQHARPWVPEPNFHNPADPAEEAAFAALLDALRTDGVRAVVVQAPLYRPVAILRPAEDARLVALVASRGFPLLNYPADPGCPIGDDAADFWDWSHLGERGAARFSERLSRDLVRLGFLRSSPPPPAAR